ncbi:acyltransferase [Acidobacteriota bacterium]
MENPGAGDSVQKDLLKGDKSKFGKYKELFVGEKGFFFLLKYELIQLFFSGIPGGLGYTLRGLFYPSIFKHVGRGVVFGRNMTIRHPHKITIGDQTHFDDNVVLDAKGDVDEGIVLGNHVIIGRNTILSCKGGSISLGDFCNIASNCSLLSESIISIGSHTFLAGHCFLVAGGNHSYERTDVPIMFQPSFSRGGIRISEDVWIGASVTITDGVEIGTGCIIGASSLVRENIPEFCVAVGVPARVVKHRKS